LKEAVLWLKLVCILLCAAVLYMYLSLEAFKLSDSCVITGLCLQCWYVAVHQLPSEDVLWYSVVVVIVAGFVASAEKVLCVVVVVCSLIWITFCMIISTPRLWLGPLRTSRMQLTTWRGRFSTDAWLRILTTTTCKVILLPAFCSFLCNINTVVTSLAWMFAELDL